MHLPKQVQEWNYIMGFSSRSSTKPEYAQCGGHFCLRKTLASANILDVHRHDLLPIYYIKLYYRSGMRCITVSVNSSLTGYRFGSIIFRRGKCFVSLRTISECGGIHEPKRNTSQSQTQSTRGIRLSVLLAICLQPLWEWQTRAIHRYSSVADQAVRRFSWLSDWKWWGRWHEHNRKRSCNDKRYASGGRTSPTGCNCLIKAAYRE